MDSIRKITIFGPVLMLVGAVLMFTPLGLAQSVDMCTETVMVIEHPAQYVTEKTKKGGVRCFVQPICCTPAWVTDPICYVINDKKVKDAWDESKKILKCEIKSVEAGVQEFVDSWTSPLAIVATPPLLQFYKESVDMNLATAAPLPDDVKSNLSKILGAPGIPFDQGDINRARWKKESDPIAKPLFPGTYRQGNPAITHGDLIVVHHDFLNATGCERYARWAHEITHVFQNRRDGQTQFLNNYILEAKEKGYDNISYEREAVTVETLVKSAAVCSKF